MVDMRGSRIALVLLLSAVLSACALAFGPKREVSISIQYLGSYLKENSGIGNDWGPEEVKIFGIPAALDAVIARDMTTWDEISISIRQVELDEVYDDIGTAEYKKAVYSFIKEFGLKKRIQISTYVFECRGISTGGSTSYAVWESIFDINIVYSG